MNKGEIDLSAFPSYLGVRAAAQVDDARPQEAVLRGLVHATLAGLVGVVLGVAVSRQALVSVNVDMLTSAVTSAAMVLLYVRGAGSPPRRGLVPLLVLIVVLLLIGLAADVVSRTWWVYDLLDEQMDMPMGRGEFMSSVLSDHGIFPGRLLFPFTVCGLAGTCLALWKVRRRTKG